MKLRSAFIILAFLLLVSCSTSKTDDIPNEMPSDFAIWFSYSIDPDRPNAIDTYKGKIYKDLIMNGVASADYSISSDDLEEIYAKLIEHKIYNITEEMTSYTLMTSPLIRYVITFTINKKEYTVTGDATVFYHPRDSKDFKAFCDYMTEFIRSTEEFQSFPNARGGYD